MGNRHCVQIVQVAVAAQGQTFLNKASHKVKVSLFTASGKPDFAVHEEPCSQQIAHCVSSREQLGSPARVRSCTRAPHDAHKSDCTESCKSNAAKNAMYLDATEAQQCISRVT